MRKRDFERKYYPKYRPVITAIARKVLTKAGLAGDAELMADLEQTGAITLWQLDVEKATTNPDSWIRQAIKFRMIDFLRATDPGQYESLDARLAHGEQLEQLGDGELCLYRGHPKSQRPPKLFDATDWETLDENAE